MAKGHPKKSKSAAGSKAKPSLPPQAAPRHDRWPKQADIVVIVGVLVYIVLLSLFALRNNDIWWHLAVGKTMLETKRFITQDPFSFAIMGAPWVPQSWLAGIVFHAIHSAFSAAGLVALRALIVCATFVLSVRVLKRLGVSLTLVAPLVVVVALTAHSRFIIRPHLFEYLFIVILLGYLVTARDHGSRSFFVLPVVLQVLWVNMHASFFLGPLIVLMFYAGESMSRSMHGSLGSVPVVDAPAIPWRRVGILLGLMALASLINPNPMAFISQPLSGEQRELLTRYTMEWRSPFDPALANAAFHPYYEMLLGIAALAFVVSIRRLQLASILLVGVFAVLSMKAHRFRVEFAVMALFFVSAQLRASPVVHNVATRLGRSKIGALVPYLMAIAAVALLIYPARDRVVLDATISDRYPADAMAFVREHDIGKRSFQSIAFGSYLIGNLYPERQTFVDGRNIDASLYQDFIACQTNASGFNNVVRKHDLDAFVIPAPERSDGGMTNLHKFLMEAGNWSLVHMDRNAYIYVRDNTTDGAWLAQHAYRTYHPMRFKKQPPPQNEWGRLSDELERAVAEDPSHLTPLLDTASFAQVTGDNDRAQSAIEAAVELIDAVLSRNPEDAQALSLRERLRSAKN